jgi:putative PEP-CTERM system TPR-repeat lipoprotein
MTLRRSSALVLAMLAMAAAGCSAGKTPAQYMANGDQYFKAKQYLEAIIEYRNAVAKSPHNGEAHLKLGDVYVEVNALADATQEYKRATELRPDDVDTQVKWLRMLLLGKWYDDVRERTEKLLLKHPQNVTAQLLHANALAGLKKYDSALAEIQQAIALEPVNGESYLNLGTIQLMADRPQLAEAAFKKAVEVDPQSVNGQIAYAGSEWAHGRLANAEKAFNRAVELEPDNPIANRALATFYLGSGRAEEAEVHLKALANEMPTTPVRLTLADYYIRMQHVEEAVAVLKVVARSSDGYAQAHSRLAILAYDAGRTADAHKEIDDALRRDPNSARALVTKATFLLKENKSDEAFARAKAAVAADPRFLAGHYLLGQLYASRRDTAAAIREYSDVLRLDPSALTAQNQLARLHLASGQAYVASGFADQLTKARPDDTQARLLLIRTLLAQGDLKRADSETRALLTAAPQLVDAHVIAGTLAVLKKDLGAARQSFERARALDDKAFEPVDGLIAVELAAGRRAAAIALAEGRLAEDPGSAMYLQLAGRTYAMAGAMDKAERAFRQAIDLEPANPEPYGELARIYLSQQRLDQSLAEYDEVVKRNPKPVAAHTMAAMILEMQNKPAAAQKRYERALELDPHSTVAANNLAWMLVTRGGNLDVALQLAQGAKREAPDQPVVNDTLGWIYVQKGLASFAIPPLEISVDKDPKNPSYRYHLGLAYAKVGESKRAQQALSEALKLQPDFEGAADARRLLASTQQ